MKPTIDKINLRAHGGIKSMFNDYIRFSDTRSAISLTLMGA